MSILAKYASCAGNFTEVTEQILAKISPENSRMTYSHGPYLFHYICENRIIYLAITDDDFDQAKAFVFLGEVQRRFTNQYGSRAHTALAYAMNSEFSTVLAAQMKHFSDQPSEHLAHMRSDVDELKHIMVKNIDQIASRGEKLELLVDKTDNLRDNSITFRTTSRNLARALWWKNFKLTIVLVIVVVVVLYFIITAACGGFAWSRCVGGSHSGPSPTSAPSTTTTTTNSHPLT